MNARWFWSLIASGVALTFVLFFVLTVPLGVPGEWVWPRIDYSASLLSDVLFGMVLLLVVAGVWLVLVVWGSSRIESFSNLRRIMLLSLLWGVSVGVVGTLQSLPGVAGFPKSWVLYYPNMSGYFHLARYEMDDASEFLRSYENRMAEGDVLHVGTHPPGLFLINHWLWDALDERPSFSESLSGWMSASTREEFQQLEQTQRLSGISLTQTDRAVLFVFATITEWIAVATIFPLFILIKRLTSAELAWKAVAFWPLVPALSLFLPKSDALFPFLGMLFLMFWVIAVEDKRSWAAVSAGFVFWCGSMLSLAIVPMGLIAGGYSLIRIRRTIVEAETSERIHCAALRTEFLMPALSVFAFLFATLMMGVAYQINLFAVWLLNYRNHAAFYDEYTRTFWKWLLLNPMETVFAVGVPVFLTSMWGIRHWWRNQSPPALLGAMLIVWGAIWLSGKNNGEAARLWLVFHPLLCLFLAFGFEALAEKSGRHNKTLLLLLIAQLAVCVITNLATSGFSV